MHGMMLYAKAEYAVVCWFSRVKTSDLYLRDASLLADIINYELLHIINDNNDTNNSYYYYYY